MKLESEVNLSNLEGSMLPGSFEEESTETVSQVPPVQRKSNWGADNFTLIISPVTLSLNWRLLKL